MDGIRQTIDRNLTASFPTSRPAVRKGAGWRPRAVGLAGIAAAAIVLAVLFGLGGLSYYVTPLRVRAYSAGHVLLRPSGDAGRAFGIAGAVMMFGGTLAYIARKNLKLLAGAGSLKSWLEVHIFFGILGPVLVALHTSFKFNGLISVAFWSMLLVVSSGFVGRYLYVRIPRSLRGVEMDRQAIEVRAAALKLELLESGIPVRIVRRIEALEQAVVPVDREPGVWDLVVGERSVRRRVRTIDREIRSSGIEPELVGEACRVEAERVLLLRRGATLELTRRLFTLWHVFHRPFVWILASIFVLHVGVAIYFGYATGAR